MTSIHPILASDDYDGMIKLIGGVIVLIVWGVGAMVSTIKKAQAQAQTRQKQARAPYAIPLPAQRTVAGQARPASLPPPLPMALPPLSTLGGAQATRQRAVRQAPPAAKQARAAAPPARPVARIPSPPPKPAVAPRPATPDTIAGLLRPTTVRAQFILAEVLQPPLALRTKQNF